MDWAATEGFGEVMEEFYTLDKPFKSAQEFRSRHLQFHCPMMK